MATEKGPTKAEFLEALRQKGITTLDELMDAILPETGGFVYETADDQSGYEGVYHPAAAIDKFFAFGFGPAGDVAPMRAPRAHGPF